MEIYFLRHGDSPKGAGIEDGKRPLSDRGAARMKRVASGMARLGVHPDLVLTSPLVRARQTAEIVARVLGLLEATAEDERLSPGFDVSALARIIHDHPDSSSLMLVGHEPDFSATIAACTGGGRVECKKGSLARVDMEKLVSLEGTLVWLLPPEALEL